ncbi:prolipoprotein diacylglyceryl transferase [Fulvivirga sp.]|uniref:prolipoprotein diacylglyceryl transferase n=1 Tax=Fulvivirga sp. TaxID=1931237 RepID=UPI0032EE9DA7
MMAFIHWDINPQIFPDFEYLRWYGLFWAIGILLAIQVMQHLYKKEGFAIADLDKLVIYLILGIIIGARFGHILFYDPVYYWHNPIEILPISLKPGFHFTGLAGLASHGGVLGGLLALYLYTRKYKKDFLWILDRLVIVGPLLGGFIRLGNLMNSEILGTPTQLPWAFVFSRIDLVPRHPAQLYEAIFYLLTSLILCKMWKSRKWQEHKGFLFGMGFTLIFVQRFLIEFVKEDQVAFEGSLWLNMGQTLSLFMIAFGIGLMFWSQKSTRPLKHRKESSVG